jgi:hypothetical protein
VTVRQLAKVLIEKVADPNIDKKVAVYVNRLMLRLHAQPAFLTNLVDVNVFKPGVKSKTQDQVEDGEFNEPEPDNRPAHEEDESGAPDSVVILQLSFRKLPAEVIAPLVRLIASPREPKITRYTKDGSARMGVEIDLKPNDFPGEEYEYSF